MLGMSTAFSYVATAFHCSSGRPNDMDGLRSQLESHAAPRSLLFVHVF